MNELQKAQIEKLDALAQMLAAELKVLEAMGAPATVLQNVDHAQVQITAACDPWKWGDVSEDD